jgi:alkylhydroperoxidase/carboxymuconolactone decarboxylase family protein YurZ
MIVRMAIYAGLPAAVNGPPAAKEVLAERSS